MSSPDAPVAAGPATPGQPSGQPMGEPSGVAPLPAVGWNGRPGFLVAAVLTLEVVLVVLWYLAEPWQGRTTSGAQWLGTISSITALAGVVLFACTVILSARFRAVEALVGGLDKVYRHHHILGSLSFTLLLVHPALLSWKYAQLSLERAAHLWGPSTRWPLLAGQFALALMVPALVLTLYVTIRHQTLVLLQRILGVLFLPAAYHSLFTGGDAYRDAPLRAYLAVICGVAVLALVKHSLLGRRLDRHHAFVVDSVRSAGPDLAELWLSSANGGLHFVPGQFAYVRFPDSAVTAEAHPFSIASAPDQDRIRFVVKELGDWTRTIETVKPGTAAVVEGPYGRFSHRFSKGLSQVWVAGGIGITPFLAMAASLAPKRCRYDIDLVWCYPTHDAAPFLDELRELATARTNLRIHARCDLDHPLLTAASLAELSAASGTSLGEREILICGPAVMRDALGSQLRAAGIDATRIHDEEFRYA